MVDKLVIELAAGSEQEGLSMQCALQSKRKGADGFQGCVNYRNKKNGCTFDGFYLALYSREGLCQECELKEYSQRYQGCLFCRKPQSFSGPCLDCGLEFSKWVCAHVKMKHADVAANCLAGTFGACDYKAQLVLHVPGEKQPAALFRKWRGLYVGNGQWALPEFKLVDVAQKATWENKDQILDELLQSVGIHIKSEVQYVKN